MRPSLTTTASLGSASAICSVQPVRSRSASASARLLEATTEARRAWPSSCSWPSSRRATPWPARASALAADACSSSGVSAVQRLARDRRARPISAGKFLPMSQSMRPMWTTGMPSGSGSTSLHTDMRTGSAPSTIRRSNLREHAAHLLLVARERRPCSRRARTGNARRRATLC